MPFPSPLLSIPSLSADQAFFQGITFGPGGPFQVQTWEGLDKPDVRSGNTDRPRTRGAFVGTNLLKTRTITATIDIGPCSGPVAQLTNLAKNPSFEYDTVGAAPAWWVANVSGTAPSTFQAQNGWSARGSNALRYTVTLPASGTSYGGTPQGTSGMLVTAGSSYAFQATLNVLENSGGATCNVYVQWFNSSGTLLSQTAYPAAPIPGAQTVAAVVTAPASAAYAGLLVGFENGTGGVCDTYLDAVAFTASAVATSYFDGDTPGYEWSGASGNSTSTPYPGWGTYGPYGSGKAGFAAALSALRAAISTEGNTEYPLWIQMPGQPLVACMARVLKAGVKYDITADIGGLLRSVPIQFEATDPYLYSAPTQSPSVVLPTPGGGFSFPVGFPLSFGGGSSANQVAITNAGNVPCWPVLVITGPCLNPRVTNESVAGNPTISLGLQLYAGDVLMVDMDAQTITYTPSGESAGFPQPQILQTGSTFWSLPPGNSTVGFNSQDSAPAAGTLSIWNASAFDGLIG